ncbi:dethiobiotin synthase [Kiloniella majae]|uniref:dethiobiotin synthase n=1 Tax=Kiloniella majae TaxID=1938558 RepID=UPI000A27833B|nr:dethiobiotin synthase [Kiloniella majae]
MQDSPIKKSSINGLFVTGTDTEVGKTFVSAALVESLRASYWKPVQTGPDLDHDTPEILRLTGGTDRKIYPCSYSFPDPLSPHEAARRVRETIDLDKIELPSISENEFLIVEGAGGALVPLNDQFMMTDLMVKVNLPVVIVARSGLGTINHTLLTIEALQRRGVTLAGVIMNGPENKGNREAIEEYGKIPVVAELPRCELVTPETIIGLMPRLERFSASLGRS